MRPTSMQGLAFLELGERLRQRGQYEAAATVTLAGLAHYPSLAEAHDLLGRIRADQGEDAGAIAAWHAALECTPGHVGALKGLAFVAFRGRDFATAERYLEQAASSAPHDTTVLSALDKVRGARPASATNESSPRLDDLDAGLLLLDAQGMRLSGGVGPGSATAAADATAAEAAGLAREAGRTARLLDLGEWQHLLIECEKHREVVLPVTSEATLVVVRPAMTPSGRVLAMAQRASTAAREWLERLG